jgi:hypothetical protein
MGVQRKPVQINWLASFGLVVLAGCFYRISKMNHTIFKAQLQDISSRIGLTEFLHPSKQILPDTSNSSIYKKGEWEFILQNKNHYRYLL